MQGRLGVYVASVFVMGVAVLPLTGCFMAAREVVGTVRGAHSDVTVTQPIANLTPYHQVRVVPVTNGVGADFTSAYQATFAQDMQNALQARHLLNPGQQPALVLSTRVTTLRANTFRKMVVQVTLTDAASGRALGAATVTSQVSGVNTFESVIESSTDEIAALIAQHQGR